MPDVRDLSAKAKKISTQPEGGTGWMETQSTETGATYIQGAAT
jgi:hypothetical protein